MKCVVAVAFNKFYEEEKCFWLPAKKPPLKRWLFKTLVKIEYMVF